MNVMQVNWEQTISNAKSSGYCLTVHETTTSDLCKWEEISKFWRKKLSKSKMISSHYNRLWFGYKRCPCKIVFCDILTKLVLAPPPSPTLLKRPFSTQQNVNLWVTGECIHILFLKTQPTTMKQKINRSWQ